MTTSISIIQTSMLMICCTCQCLEEGDLEEEDLAEEHLANMADTDFEVGMVLVKDMAWRVATVFRVATVMAALVWDSDSMEEGLDLVAVVAVAGEEVEEKEKAEVVEVEAAVREDRILEASKGDIIGISVITMIENSS